VKPNRRSVPVGAEVTDSGVEFRVWAPIRKTVEVVFDDGRAVPLQSEGAGYFSGLVRSARAGFLYKYKLDGSETCPDPATRFQPEGPHGWSVVVDASTFPWTDQKWHGVALPHQVIYEMHVGTFTEQGTWASAEAELQHLAALGVTVLELMPVAEFPGRFGWGYDGVQWFAPAHIYGSPDDFRRFVDRAHSIGLGVILDVVYNHLGPDGNYLGKFAPQYFCEKTTDWGAAINYDGEDSGPVREFVLSNACYWIDEFHLDGLRLDATQDIHDSSKDHILRAMAGDARKHAAPREIIFIAENEPQQVKLVKSPKHGGYGLDGLWNDDFHHSAMVALTGRNEAYYTDYLGTPQEFVSSMKYGYLYQGQRYRWQKKRRGTPGLDSNPAAFVTFIQNHDQIANSAYGQRCNSLTSPGKLRAITALMLLAPGTPMLFQGQEFAASSPFLFFADHNAELSQQIRQGRAEFLAQFPSLATPEMQERFADPADPATFERCKLNHCERETHREIYELHRDLLELRRYEPAFRAQRPRGLDGAVLSGDAFVLRYFCDDGGDRLLLVNLGVDLHLNPAPEPLLAPPADSEWTTLWSSENPKYGGIGMPLIDSEDNWRIPGHAAVVLRPEAVKSSEELAQNGARRETVSDPSGGAHRTLRASNV
jgi:maltooligosyltrehalose trehalohydrolase